jgi:hypothetical protein
VSGIDVGEDFLDIATFAPQKKNFRLARIDLREINIAPARNPRRSQRDVNPVTSLRAMLTETVPELYGAIVLVDSPRWPRDLAWPKATLENRCGRNMPMSLRDTDRTSGPRSFTRGREIDASLRALVAALRSLNAGCTLRSISMFPTPPMTYFGAQLNFANCKPHLRSLGQALFGDALNRDYGPPSGGIFTRFMIAGFATYRALDPVAGELYECYPDLQFRLWCGGQVLTSKNSTEGRRAALESRVRVLSTLVSRLGIHRFPQIQRIDEADAAILALSTAAAQSYGALLVIQNAYEGKFMVALDGPEAQRFQSRLLEVRSNAATIDAQRHLPGQ